MFRLHVARGFHIHNVSKSLGNVHVSVPISTWYRGLVKNQEKNQKLFHHVAVRRSSLKQEVRSRSGQPLFLSRCFSSASSSKLSDEGKLIYTGNLGKAVLGVKMFSYTSSGFSLSLLPYLLMKTGLGVTSVALQVAFSGFVGFFMFLTPVLLHFLTRGYVVRLYHHPDTDSYTAVTVSVLLVPKKTVFHQSQVKIPGVSQMFTTFHAGKTGLLVNPALFPFPQDYNHLMGYDRPFSFQTDDLDES